jgi:competence/damage-inducible protein CinA-like protein
MVVELLNTGTELLLGRVLNTHQQWLCTELARLGYQVSRQTTLPDTAADLECGVREALGRADLVITTGGLGPTSDDLTREELARLLGRPLHEDPAVLEHINRYFQTRNRPMPERTRRQAQVPLGARVLPNPYGTAPGLALELHPNPFRPGGAPSWLLMLPGPTRELRPMFAQAVVPLLQRVLPCAMPFVCRTLRTTGLGESSVEETVAAPLEPLLRAGVEVGYCARPGQVDVRLVGRGPQASELVRQAEAVVCARLGHAIYGVGDEDLEQTIIRVLTERKQTLALAESCTGGLLAHRLTNVPGASAVLLAGVVTYSNEAKQRFVGVKPATLAAYGAVSEPVAREMAEGARQAIGSDFALALTGIAGPGGGSEAKPVGTVFIALAAPGHTRAEHHTNAWDRETFKYVSSQQALNLLRTQLEPGV